MLFICRLPCLAIALRRQVNGKWQNRLSLRPLCLSGEKRFVLYLSRNSIAGGRLKTSRMAGSAAAMAVRMINGTDIPSAFQFTP